MFIFVIAKERGKYPKPPFLFFFLYLRRYKAYSWIF